MGRQLACIRTFFINGQGPLKRQVTCVPTKMRQLNRQLRVREVAAVRMSVRELLRDQLTELLQICTDDQGYIRECIEKF